MAAQLHGDSLSRELQHVRCLAQVLSLTRQMLDHADKGEWEEVTEIEQERRDDLVACFSRPVPSENTELVAEAMATLLHLNEELMAKLRVARSAVMAQGRELTKNRQAVSTYQTVDAALQPAR